MKGEKDWIGQTLGGSVVNESKYGEGGTKILMSIFSDLDFEIRP